ncbi:MAG: RNA polymerase sigma-70 factor [Maribacter dokdonensis]|uniref:RNA polymerase sigma-70 factor, ECF subfamily n=2 Tax=Maribacter dokdonensis TaxID=320912 RepID=A0A1H4QGK2_9FLAO|nr:MULTISPECIES: RNA polymerase sigma-70 factor [Maribacter]APA65517.1 LuxR family transcriptional regulator [Maribacter sp. 1_2014MBL_MicDiv]MDP2527911.1 RNA polymerase sigma-70 factor [Maribacter dokdonensis]PHN93361.1 RNA polymerase sigma-70 factor [Maribacter sp. 6B07]SEC18761.1 RNA polymerase sigma-70 factor, ECF subfamily [Maribacter dokdonensis]
MDAEENRRLIKKLISGEEKAYILLLEKYHQQLNAYAVTLTHDQSTAQDIVQNVFLKTWKSRKKLNPEFSIRNFLYKCVYNEFLNTYQKNKAVVLLNKKYIEYSHEVAVEFDDNMMSKMMDIVNREIKKLPPKCQKVFVLSKKEGLSNSEIADYLDVSIKTVEAQITKAFRILKNELGDKYETILLIIFNKKLV